MKLENTTVLLTGAGGGIGSLVALGLARRGARLALLDHNAKALDEVAAAVREAGGHALPLALDLLDPLQRQAALEKALEGLGGIDLLINNAGLMSFRPFAEESPERLQALVRLNLETPLLLTRALLPGMLARGRGRIVNVGSTFGSIGFAWFAAYSASKAGLQGLSEALRRELADTPVGVTYIAPRAVRTPLNTGPVMRMAERVKMNMDEPAWVAQRIVAAIEEDRKELFLGFPESLFVRINALLPRLVDLALRGQNRAMEPFAREG
jgi:short-subunit dehydrogenase